MRKLEYQSRAIASHVLLTDLWQKYDKNMNYLLRIVLHKALL